MPAPDLFWIQNLLAALGVVLLAFMSLLWWMWRQHGRLDADRFDKDDKRLTKVEQTISESVTCDEFNGAMKSMREEIQSEQRNIINQHQRATETLRNDIIQTARDLSANLHTSNEALTGRFDRFLAIWMKRNGID